jgi:hypothetical protein
VLVGVAGQGEIQALGQPGLALDQIARRRQRRAHVVERVYLGIPVAELTGQPDRLRSPVQRRRAVVGQHARLSAQEHQPAAAVKRLAEQPLQRGQEPRPLDQHIVI